MTDSTHNTKQLGDLKTENITLYLLRDEYVAFVGRILTKYIPWLSKLAKSVSEHISQRYSEEMATKSVIIGLPVKPYVLKNTVMFFSTWIQYNHFYKN